MNRADVENGSPTATGGLGFNFETRIQAAFTVLLLTGGVSPCITGDIKKIQLQGGFAGYRTDDIIVHTSDVKTGKSSKLLGQIKHRISITANDDVFEEVLSDAWSDFNNAEIFSTETDQIALITGMLSSRDCENVRPILEWAKHAENEDDFVSLVNGEGSSSIKREKLEAFRQQLKKANGGHDLSDSSLWNFLKHFHLLIYDLDVEKGSTLPFILALIAQSSQEEPFSVWCQVLEAVQSFNQSAGTIALSTLEGIRSLFSTNRTPNLKSDMQRLSDHSRYISKDIKSDIGGEHINRSDLICHLLDKSEKYKFIYVSGKRGCGKSGLVRDFAESLGTNVPVFYFRALEFEHAHLDGLLNEIGVTSTLSELEANFALLPKKYLLIESIEKLLELQSGSSFRDLLQFVDSSSGWTIIATGRDYAYQDVSFNYLAQFGFEHSTLQIDGFTDDQVQQLLSKLSPLNTLRSSFIMKNLIKNPFNANLAHWVLKQEGTLSGVDGERKFQDAVWDNVIARNRERQNGMPEKRRRLFIDIAVCRAKRMVHSVPASSFDSETLYKLEEDNVISWDKNHNLVSPSHDIFEDWGLEKYIEMCYQNSSGCTEMFLQNIGHEPAMNRAFRLWLYGKLDHGADVDDLINSILLGQEIERCWQDETINAIINGDQALSFISNLEEKLLANECDLLKRFCHVLRISCKIPYKGSIDDQPILMPYGSGWELIISFLYKHKDELPSSLQPLVCELLQDWSWIIHIDKDYPKVSRESGLLALFLIEKIDSIHKMKKYSKMLVNVIIKVAPEINDEFTSILVNNHKDPRSDKRRPHYVDELIEASLTDLNSAFLCKYLPDFLINLALNELIQPSNVKRSIYYSEDTVDGFGISHLGTQISYFPPSGARSPFRPLLRYHPWKGIRLIIGLLNIAAERYAHSKIDDPSKIRLVNVTFSDGTIIKQYCSERLWFCFRGYSVAPYVLESALMALEDFLVDLLENDLSGEAERVFNVVLRHSNSVMPTAMLASVATGHPKELGKAALPILDVPDFYDLDLNRYIHEKTDFNFYLTSFNHNPISEFYLQQRKRVSSWPWRLECIETLIVKLQFSSLRPDALQVLDKLRTSAPKNEQWGFRFHRIDTRGWEPEVDEENNRIIFNTGKLEPELESISNETQNEQDRINRLQKLYVWSENHYKKGESEINGYASWRDVFRDIKELSSIREQQNGKTLEDVSRRLAFLFSSGIVKGSVVLLRDYSDEMTAEERDFCWTLVTLSVLTDANSYDQSLYSMTVAHHCATASASILPLLYDSISKDDGMEYVKKVIATAVTHSDDDVRKMAAIGIKKYLWQRDAHFAQLCYYASIEYAWIIGEFKREKGYQRIEENEFEVLTKRIERLREHLIEGNIKLVLSCDELNSHTVHYSLVPCLMVPVGSIDSDHILFLSRVLSAVIESQTDEDKAGKKKSKEIQINFDIQNAYLDAFSEYIAGFNNSENRKPFTDILKDACRTAPFFVSSLMLMIRREYYHIDKGKQYWDFWDDFFDFFIDFAILIKKEKGHKTKDDKDRLIQDFLFYDIEWNHNSDELTFIDCRKQSITKFVASAGTNPHVIDAMSKLMYNFPQLFMEQGLNLIAKRVRDSDEERVFSANGKFYLEKSIRRLLFSDNHAYLGKETINNCITILENMIASGSSGAYYLREHLIQTRVMN